MSMANGSVVHSGPAVPSSPEPAPGPYGLSLVLRVGAERFAVRPLPGQAWRLRGGDGRTLDVVPHPAGHTCECPAWTLKRGEPGCEHVAAFVSIGLLPPSGQDGPGPIGALVGRPAGMAPNGPSPAAGPTPSGASVRRSRVAERLASLQAVASGRVDQVTRCAPGPEQAAAARLSLRAEQAEAHEEARRFRTRNFARWLDRQAGRYRKLGCLSGDIVADALDDVAREVRALSSPGMPITPTDYLDRLAAMERWAAERDEA